MSGTALKERRAFLLLIFAPSKLLPKAPQKVSPTECGGVFTLPDSESRTQGETGGNTGLKERPLRCEERPYQTYYSCLELLEPVLEVLDLFQLSSHVVQHHTLLFALELHS